MNSYNDINATKKEPEKEDSDDRLEIMEKQNNEQEEEFLELEENLREYMLSLLKSSLLIINEIETSLIFLE